MSDMSRRDMNKLLAGGAAVFLMGNKSATAQVSTKYRNSVFGGVHIGVQSYSFRDRVLEAFLNDCEVVGLGECEMWQGHVEPHHLSREELRQWRLTVPLSYFHSVRQKYDKAKVLLYAYSYNIGQDFTEGEIMRGFEFARALGVKYVTTSSPMTVVHKVDMYAQKYGIVVGFHNHDETWKPNQFSNAASFERGLKGTSNWVGVNLDVGHFVAANSDPVTFLEKWHSRIVTLHLKDRKRNHGPAVPWGEGDTPLVAVLRLLQKNHWQFPGNIEYEYGKLGVNTVANVARSFKICKRILTTDCQGKSCYMLS